MKPARDRPDCWPPRPSLEIEGPGAGKLTVGGDGRSQVFDVSGGVTATIAGLTIADGSASLGAGIANSGTLTVANCTLSGNAAPSQLGFGGGIFIAGSGGPLLVRTPRLECQRPSARIARHHGQVGDPDHLRPESTHRLREGAPGNHDKRRIGVTDPPGEAQRLVCDR